MLSCFCGLVRLVGHREELKMCTCPVRLTSNYRTIPKLGMLIKKVLKDTVCQEGLNYSECTGAGEAEAIIHILNRQEHRIKEILGTCAPYEANEPHGPKKSYLFTACYLIKATLF